MTDITKLARERTEKIKSWRGTYGAGSNVMLPAEEAEELASMALAAMDNEPVVKKWPAGLAKMRLRLRPFLIVMGAAQNAAREFISMKSHTLHLCPLRTVTRVRREHAEWSQATFGNVGPVGPPKHLRREVLETIAKPPRSDRVG